jgi:hypothetical protein
MFQEHSACFQLLHEHALHTAGAKSQEASYATVGACVLAGSELGKSGVRVCWHLPEARAREVRQVHGRLRGRWKGWKVDLSYFILHANVQSWCEAVIINITCKLTWGLVGLPSDDSLADASLAISVGIRFPLLSGIRTCPSPGPAYGSGKRDDLHVE